MGYLPIFLYLASFVFLFLIVVNNSMKTKKIRFQKSLESLAEGLQEHSGKLKPEINSLADAEQYYLQMKLDWNQSEEDHTDHITAIKPLFMRVRQQQYFYNNLIKTKPYSFVAKMFGHHAI